MNKAILTINAGSSSVKFCLFTFDKDMKLLAGGRIVDIQERRHNTTPVRKPHPERRVNKNKSLARPDKKVGAEGPVFTAKSEKNGVLETRFLTPDASHEDALDVILDWIDENKDESWNFSTVAHRVVHGGSRFVGPAPLTAKNLAYLESLCPLAPLHQTHNLAPAKILAAKNPKLKQYACCDTAFHAQRDKLFSSFALPKNLRDQGIQRYGFHGLSYSWIAHCLSLDFPKLAKGRVVVAHLGNGASLCAIKDGKSVDTTMTMTALDGLPMGTRSGSIDASAVIYMQRSLGLTVDQVERILYHESGLKGLSGISNDVKTLSGSDKESARFALDYFAIKTAQFIASMAVAIGGIDGLIFTGGIGENAAGVRKAILSHLTFLPAFETHVIPANEELGMAQSIFEIQEKGKTA
jgi:acetate kinase